MIARTVRIAGRVQGVGFRWAAVQAAERHGVVGWVRNSADGSVEVLVQGPPDDVEAMVSWLSRGPRSARVDTVEVGDGAIDESLTSFGVRS